MRNIINVPDDRRCPQNVISERDGVDYRRIDHITYYSSHTNGNRRANVLLPVDYDNNKKYPVIYILHGIYGNENALLYDTDGRIPEMMGNMYLDQMAPAAISVYVSMFATKDPSIGAGFDEKALEVFDNFIYDLVDSLVPYIDSRYPTLTNRENRAIFGFSMGAKEALYIGLKRNDLFGNIAAAAPAPGLVPGEDWAMKHPGLFSDEDFGPQVAEYKDNLILICCAVEDSAVGKFPEHYHEVLEANHVKHYWTEVPEINHGTAIIQSTIYFFMQLWMQREKCFED